MTTSGATREVIAVHHIGQFCQRCEEFIRRQYREIIHGQPSEQKRAEHRHELKWLLRMAEALRSVAADQEFPNRSLKQRLNGKVWQIEESWELLYNPPAPEETERLDRLMAETFPDEPGA